MVDVLLKKAYIALRPFKEEHPDLKDIQKSHRSGTATLNFQRNSPVAARGKVAKAAALAVFLDLRLLLSSLHFAKSIFEIG